MFSFATRSLATTAVMAIAISSSAQSLTKNQVFEPHGAIPVFAEFLHTELRVVDADLLTAAAENSLIFSGGRILTREEVSALALPPTSGQAVRWCRFIESRTPTPIIAGTYLAAGAENTLTNADPSEAELIAFLGFTNSTSRIALECRTIGSFELLSIEAINETIGASVATLARGQSRFQRAMQGMQDNTVEASGGACSPRSVEVLQKYGASNTSLARLLSTTQENIQTMLQNQRLTYLPQMMQAYNSIRDQMTELCQAFAQIDLPAQCTTTIDGEKEEVPFSEMQEICPRIVPAPLGRIVLRSSAHQ